MKNLVFYGASPFGDEIVQLFRDINRPLAEWNIVGFLDDNPSMVGTIRNGVPVLGNQTWLESIDIHDVWFVCCIGNPQARERVVSSLNERGARFATGIHPTVTMSDSVQVGEGTTITAANVLTTNIQVGRHVIINLACTVGHYSVIEDFVTVNPGANISGNVKIEKCSYVGTNAAILEKLTVGANSIIGAGAVVNKNIPAGVTAVGVPARVIKTHV
jgi:sugar O-acyltransferase (sialic acid O-acetyltransferase NeuD family)